MILGRLKNTAHADEIDYFMIILILTKHVPWSKVAILGMAIPPLMTGILIMGPYKPLLLG